MDSDRSVNPRKIDLRSKWWLIFSRQMQLRPGETTTKVIHTTRGAETKG